MRHHYKIELKRPGNANYSPRCVKLIKSAYEKLPKIEVKKMTSFDSFAYKGVIRMP